MGGLSARRWCFTINNPTNWVYLGGDMKYLIYQQEKGENGTMHLQGYVKFNKSMSLKGAKEAIGQNCHVEPAKGTDAQCIAYCSKEESRIDGPWSWGEPGEDQGKRNDLNEVRLLLDNGASMRSIATEHFSPWVKYHKSFEKYLSLCETDYSQEFRDVELIVYVGPTGCGKTMWAYEKYGVKNVYKLPYGNSNNLWFDGYRNQKVLLIDDFRGHIPYWNFLNLTDRYPYQCQVKGSMIYAAWDTVVVTSNSIPSTWWNDDLAPFWRRVNDNYMEVPGYGDQSPKEGLPLL